MKAYRGLKLIHVNNVNKTTFRDYVDYDTKTLPGAQTVMPSEQIWLVTNANWKALTRGRTGGHFDKKFVPLCTAVYSRSIFPL